VRAVSFPFLRLGLLTGAAFAIHGYHLGVEDAEIFIPSASKLIHPELYPFGAEFFQSHASLSLFGHILAVTARLGHLGTDATVFFWYLVTLFAMLAASWMLAARCFSTGRARWAAVCTVAAALTMPAANTGLPLMDPYLTARSFSTPLTVFALAAFLGRRTLLAALLAAVSALVHPQMTLYLLLLLAVLCIAERILSAAHRLPAAALAAILPGDFHLGPAQPPYREALYARDYFFLYNWTWYDWLGLIAPLAILCWFLIRPPRATTPAFARLCRGLIPFGLIAIAAAALISASHIFDMYARLQPLRCFHLITVVFVLLLGGVAGEYAAAASRWLFPAICIGIAALMFLVARDTYPVSPHIEWPSTEWSSTEWSSMEWSSTGWPSMRNTSNAWVNTLLWIRRNTPTDAVFAVDSRYFNDPGVDKHGFRAISRRSKLADYFKDSGAVALFPSLAGEWKQQADATYGLNRFTLADFTRLAQRYPVTWTVIHGPAPAGMNCPYQRGGYAVCKIPSRTGLLAAVAR